MQAQNPSHALALVLVDELARCGVTDAVLAPGSRSAALAMALHDDPRLRLHVQVDERSAGFLAVGLGRATGRPAAVVVTSGSAVANLHPAVVEAHTGAVPLLLLTADRPPELRGTGANQAIDQLHLFGRSVRWFHEAGAADDHPGAVAHWRSMAARAVGEALGLAGPAGPVHLNLPFREPTVPASDDGRTRAEPFSASLDGRPERRPWVSITRTPRHAAPGELAVLAGRLVATERGLIVVGQTTAPAGPIHALSRATGYPVIAEPPSGARLPGALAHAHHLLGHAGFARAHRPDLVIRIGRTGVSRNVASLLGPDVPQVLIDPDGGWHDPDRAVSHLLVADVAATCTELVDELAVPASSEWADGWAAADAAAADAVAAVLDDGDLPSEPRTARDLAAALPDGTTLVVGSSMPIRDLDQVMCPREGLRVLASRGASGIDGTVSTALGIAIADATSDGARRQPTVALVGDLTLLHDSNGFLLSPDLERVDCTFVVLDNDGGGIFSFLPQAAYPASFERVFGTPHGRDLSHLAAFHELGYHRIDLASDLPTVLTRTRLAGGIHLVHVRTDREANRQLHDRLTRAVHDALG
ncbi:2-succinyl-5-enolpyruvyl-6-hydroxy-3-cyclohexene-1-carboxylic-acid synthase [Nitriliruptor alkaliphilus]|uniref:2-succinyl-5-enolpyruvyl-6-hydroxy-3- cyclohexene-1-carboxylic-acid synthase n=1 Tax=Nitriliruptor alkaliphilus TaxID=427918 RepID=UPI0006981262|nr:2-succinyl-5-enolpyruvyl-6-hydroxy-3-cyclohexene-1-carboxylic-acid synthase [Nitriliruptor alkaliphilus]